MPDSVMSSPKSIKSGQFDAAPHLTTAHMNGHPVVMQVAHRFPGEVYGPPLVTVMPAPVALTVEEVAALLVDWMDTGGVLTDLDDDETIRCFVAESVLNVGCQRVEEAKAAIKTARVALLEYCRQRATTVFALPR